MQTPHILIVEDELVTRNTLKSIFEAEGYDVFEATDGAEMHQILSENDINLVIMDINLPGKNGLLLARELREQADVALMFLPAATTKWIRSLASKSALTTISLNRLTRVN
ncbi:Aerobic respiration control protein arcA [Klebsiella pneumoniae]|uniref:Aerobic respiration control protein arcA n=1 Tax=Klebsiella pneumoniae TaxID=573 RepID=A0A377XMC3_KLEPN|nr:Aerobic respiration control protein arcA [Klebsiella pneumoniae]